jgi:hypothetical protein
MTRRINKTRRLKRGGAEAEKIVEVGLVKDRIAFFESLKKKGWSAKELNGMIPIWEKLRKKGYNNDEIGDFFDKHRGKDIDTISQLADEMPNKQKKNNSTAKNNASSAKNNASTITHSNAVTIRSNNSQEDEDNAESKVPSAEERAALRKEKGRNNANANVEPITLFGNNSNAFKEEEPTKGENNGASVTEVPSKVPSAEERSALRKEKGRNNANANVEPITLFGNNSNTFKEEEPTNDAETVISNNSIESSPISLTKEDGTPSEEEAPSLEEEAHSVEGEEEKIPAAAAEPPTNAATTVTSISENSDIVPPKPVGAPEDVSNINISDRLRNFNGDENQDEEEEENLIQSSDFADGKGLGPSFLTLIGPWKLENEETDTFIFCPFWTIHRAANKKIGNKAEGLVFLLLQEYAKQVTQIIASDKDDDKKLIQIIALRQFTTRTIVHFCAYCGLLCNDSTADTTYVVQNPITGDDVLSYYFDNHDIKDTIKTCIFTTLTMEYIELMSKIWWKIPIQLIDIYENNAMNIVLTSLINAERLILDDTVVQKLYDIFKSERKDEVLRFFKDPIQKEATDANTLLGIDVIYSSSISPVRFVNLIELSDYIEKTYFADEKTA